MVTQSDSVGLVGEVSITAGAEDAENYYRQALALAEPPCMRPLVAHCHFGLGRLNRRMGDHREAEEQLTIATAMYREMNMTYWLEQAAVEMRQLG